MASGDNKQYVKVTLPASGPGAYAEVSTTAGLLAATDIVNLTIADTNPVTTTGDTFGVYAKITGITGTTGQVLIKATKQQTPAVGVFVTVVEK